MATSDNVTLAVFRGDGRREELAIPLLLTSMLHRALRTMLPTSMLRHLALGPEASPIRDFHMPSV